MSKAMQTRMRAVESRMGEVGPPPCAILVMPDGTVTMRGKSYPTEAAARAAQRRMPGEHLIIQIQTFDGRRPEPGPEAA